MTRSLHRHYKVEGSRGGSSGGYRKLAEMAWTWHGVAERSMYEQRWSATVDSRVRRTGSDDVDADLMPRYAGWKSSPTTYNCNTWKPERRACILNPWSLRFCKWIETDNTKAITYVRKEPARLTAVTNLGLEFDKLNLSVTADQPTASYLPFRGRQVSVSTVISRTDQHCWTVLIIRNKLKCKQREIVTKNRTQNLLSSQHEPLHSNVAWQNQPLKSALWVELERSGDLRDVLAISRK